MLDVPEGGEAAAAGLRGCSRSSKGAVELGDIIVAIDGDKISSEADLFKAIEKRKVGDEVGVTVYRHAREGDKTKEDVVVTLRVRLKST